MLPQELYEEFGACPSAADFPEGTLALYCAHVTAYDGEIKLGNVEATIDEPLEILAGIGFRDGQIVMLPVGEGADDGGEGSSGGQGGGGAGGFDPVEISGGILGIPELDPVIQNEPLGLLRLTATPQLGAISAGSADLTPSHLNPITLPLSIKLNNTLFGDDCQIGTSEDPIVINLTTGTTEPPEGVQPISGTAPSVIDQQFWWNYAFVGEPQAVFASGTGARSVDNTFVVPAAKGCDLLPQEAHDGVEELNDGLEQALGEDLPLDELLGSEAGLFDPLINANAGLPSAVGNNHMKISVDSRWIDYGAVQVIKEDLEPLWSAQPGTIDFGEVPVGESVTETATIENTRSTPITLGSLAGFTSAGHDYELASNSCAEQTLDPGEQCQVELRFSPTEAGEAKAAQFVQAVEGEPLDGPRYHHHPQVWAEGTGV
ncbi:MAG: choice-of-anchor D domain-containing protein [Thermoleophilaceae bacterium]